MTALLRRLRLDPYIAAIMLTVAIAALLPVRGVGREVLDVVVTGAIALLFFIYGAKISPRAIWEGITHWRLQGLVFLTTYAVFPLIGLVVVALTHGWLDKTLSLGLLYLCLLPSTVQSSIAFTSMSRGNVPAALCCASVSNLAGVVMTPLLVAGLISTEAGGVSFSEVRDIGLQIFLPFILGQLARPWVGEWFLRHRTLTMIVDRGSILLVVYSAFSAGVVAGIWSQITLENLIIVLVLNAVILALVLGFTILSSRALGFSKEDEITIVFCGSKKSMATGLPMASILFPAASVGGIVMPLMLFHQLQLMVCASIAGRYSRRETVVTLASGSKA